MIPIVIPSYQRAKKVISKNLVINPIICVPESEKDEYIEYNKDVEVITHPDNVIGLALKRQWIYEKFGDVFMLDDDVKCFVRKYLELKNNKYSDITDKNVITEIINTTYETAKEMNAYLFGFESLVGPKTYKFQIPFRLKGIIKGSGLGIRKSDKLFFHKDSVACEDYWICLLNAYYYRYIFVDSRFACYSDVFKGTGGLSNYRTRETEKKDLEFLVNMFGNDIVKLKKDDRSRVRKHPYERIIKLPY